MTQVLLVIALLAVGLLPFALITLAARFEGWLRAEGEEAKPFKRTTLFASLWLLFFVCFSASGMTGIAVANASPELALLSALSLAVAFSLLVFAGYRLCYLLVLLQQVKGGRVPSAPTVRRILGNWVALLGGTLLFLVGVELVLREAPGLGESTALRYLASMVLYVLVFAAVAPWVVSAFSRSTEPMESGLAERVHDLARRAGLGSPRVRILDLGEIDVANAWVAGVLGWNRTIFLTKGLLQRLDQEEILAIVAHELGHVRLRHLLVYSSLTLAALGLAFGLGGLLPTQSVVLGVFVRAMLFIGILTLGAHAAFRRCEAAADRYAAGLTSDPGTLSAALRKLHETLPERARWTRVLSTHPDLEDRLRRLQQM